VALVLSEFLMLPLSSQRKTIEPGPLLRRWRPWTFASRNMEARWMTGTLCPWHLVTTCYDMMRPAWEQMGKLLELWWDKNCLLHVLMMFWLCLIIYAIYLHCKHWLACCLVSDSETYHPNFNHIAIPSGLLGGGGSLDSFRKFQFFCLGFDVKVVLSLGKA